MFRFRSRRSVRAVYGTEASTRTAFLENLVTHVIEPLANFKVRAVSCVHAVGYARCVERDRRSKIGSANGSGKT